MSLTLYYHPLSSFCHKVLIALYENETPFTPHLVNLGDPAEADAFRRIWPMGRFPVLKDAARDTVVPESSIIIEYLARHYPGGVDLTLDKDPDAARKVRLRDRFLDEFIHIQMQKIVGDRIRPEGSKDPFGVADARRIIRAAYAAFETDLAGKTWVMGDAFTMADCAAAPALFYADRVEPAGDGHPLIAAYFQRLKARPSYARVLAEAAPYLHMFPA